MLFTTVSFCISQPITRSPVYSKNSQSTPTVIEKQNATSARYAGDSLKEKRSLSLSRSTSAKPIAAHRKPLIVCSIVSQLGTRM